MLAESLDAQQRARVIVVFDAARAPTGRPRDEIFREMTIRFASNYDSADDLIEELVRADSTPRSLVVVSSDHRLQRAARRRKGTAFDSDYWWNRVVRNRRSRLAPAPLETERPSAPASDKEIEDWIARFGAESLDELSAPLADYFPTGYAEDFSEDES